MRKCLEKSELEIDECTAESIKDSTKAPLTRSKNYLLLGLCRYFLFLGAVSVTLSLVTTILRAILRANHLAVAQSGEICLSASTGVTSPFLTFSRVFIILF